MAVRFGVAGTGYWASEVHLAGLLQTEGAEVAGLWGRNPVRVGQIAQRYRVRPFARLSDMLAEVDAVSVAVQPQAQREIAVAAAEAGKHLILEKPLALTVEDARVIEAAVRKAGVASLVFFIRRFVPEIAAVIEAERGAGWTRGQVRVHSSVMVADSPYRNSPWRQEPDAALWDIGPHVLSVLIPLLGDVRSIEAQRGPGGAVLIQTAHEDGAAVEVSLSLHADPGAVVNDYRFSAPGRELVLPNPDLQRPKVFGRAVTHLMEQVVSGRKTVDCDVALGARIVAQLAQAEDALGRRV